LNLIHDWSLVSSLPLQHVPRPAVLIILAVHCDVIIGCWCSVAHTECIALWL